MQAVNSFVIILSLMNRLCICDNFDTIITFLLLSCVYSEFCNCYYVAEFYQAYIVIYS